MRVVVLSGGPTHDFPATTAGLTALLERSARTADVHTDVDGAFAALPGAALLVVNALRWTMTVPDRYRERAATEGASPSAASRDALAAHLAAGGGVLALHTATLCFDDWPGWADALGGTWVWGRSSHPPIGPPVDVTVAGAAHPLTEGVDGFRLVDEVYTDLRRAPDTTGLLTATAPGGTAQPVLWAREHGGGRVVYDALGHHPPSYDVPEHAEILRRAVRWTTDG